MGLKDKIIVVGAGAAGLTAAYFLRERGYTDVLVLEASPEVGGKCKTLHFGGVNLDLGANLTTPRHDLIRTLGEKMGLTTRPLPPRSVVSIDGSQPKKLSFLEKTAVKLLQKHYNCLWRRSDIGEPGYAHDNRNLFVPFREWLSRNYLGKLEPMFEVLFVAYGYGALMDLPAVYALKFFDPIHLEAAVDVVTESTVPNTLEFSEGFQELWRRLCFRSNIDVMTNTKVIEVHRYVDYVEVICQRDSVYERYTADRLIIACPPAAAKQFLDCDVWEEDLLSEIRTQRYHVNVSRIEGLQKEAHYVSPYAFQVTPYKPTVIYPPGANGSNLYVSYAYGSMDEDPIYASAQVANSLSETVKKLGGTVVQRLHTQVWDYFPHVTWNAQQFYRRLEDLQGRNRTYYVGEAFSFTLTELIAEYSLHTVAKHF